MIEYCANGSLHRYLLANRVVFAEQLRRCKFDYGRCADLGVNRGINLLVAWGHQVINVFNWNDLIRSKLVIV